MRHSTDEELTLMQSVLVGPADPAIVILEARLRAAQLAADADSLDALISEDLLFTGPDGRLATKADDLSAHRSGAVRIRSHDPEELRVRHVAEDVVVAALQARLTVEAGGSQVLHGPVRYTRVWVREADGEWRVVAGHVSVVPTASAEASLAVDRL